MSPDCLREISEECFRNLPPPRRKRLTGILTDHTQAILTQRASVVRDRRGDGRPYWRLYLETGSDPWRTRQRVYVGPEGGPELREAIDGLRRAEFLGCANLREFLQLVNQAIENDRRWLRKLARQNRQAVLAQTHRHLHGRTVRARRDVPREERYRAEYRHLSRKALEAATWPGITEGEYLALRGSR